MTQEQIAADENVNQSTSTTAGMTAKVVKGSFWTLSGQLAPLAISLVTTPFVIRLLGAEGYGVLILVGLVPTYLGFADFGMGIASTKFASEAYAAGDQDKEARIVRTAALIAFLVSFPIGIVLFIFSGSIMGLFNVPEALHTDASLALKFASVTFVVNFLNGIFNTPQLTRLRMDLNTYVNAVFRMIGLIATPFAIYLDGIVGAACILMVVSLLTLLGHLVVSFRLNPSIFKFTVEKQLIVPMLKFGIALAIGGIAGLLLANSEKGILSGLVSVQALAHYSVAFTFAGMVTMFSNSMIQSLIPAFSQLAAVKNTVLLENLFRRSVTLILIVLIPSTVFLFIIAHFFFRLWAGTEFGRESTTPFQILLIGLFFNIPAYVPYSIILSLGRTDIVAKLYWIELIPYVIFIYLLTGSYGVTGTAVGWSFRVFLDGIIFFLVARKIAGVKLDIFHVNNCMALLAGAVYIPVIIVTLFCGDVLLVIIILFTVLSVFFLLTVYKFVLQTDERQWLLARLGVSC